MKIINNYGKARSAEIYWKWQIELLELKLKSLEGKKKEMETKLNNARIRKQNLEDELPDNYPRNEE